MGDRSRMDRERALWGSGISVAKIRSRGRRRKESNDVTWVVCSWATRDPHPRLSFPPASQSCLSPSRAPVLISLHPKPGLHL